MMIWRDGVRSIRRSVLAGQFEKITRGWDEGLAGLRAARAKPAHPHRQANLRTDLGLAEAAGLHFRSVANQVRFIMARDALLSGSLEGRRTQGRD